MLLGKGDTDDGDGEDQRTGQMGQRDFPAEEEEPDDIEEQCQTAAFPLYLDNFFAKGG